MYFLHSTITLLLVIAHVQCGTLRQYGPDWLIPKPAPHVGSKRITAKSVFIAPSFQPQNVRCATGFRDDGGGRCVKLVHVNQAAQLDFLLQRLNAMYGAPDVSHSEKRPLQVSVEIPVEVVNSSDTSVPLKGNVMYSDVVLPSGEVSVDLLAGTINQPDSSEETTTENIENEDAFGQVSSLESGSPGIGNDNETNMPIMPIMPSKEWFQLDEEPIVTLTSIDDEEEEDEDENTTVNSENVTNPPDVIAEVTLVNVHSEDAGVMANVMKNTSNMVKKETHLGNSSVLVASESTINLTFTELNTNETAVQSVNVVNDTKGLVPSQSTLNAEKTESTEDESVNEVNIKSSHFANGTSSQLGFTNTSEESSSVASSIPETTSEASTDQQWTTNFTSQETTTRESTIGVVTTGVPTFTTNENNGETTEENVKPNKDIVEEDIWGESGEKVENEKQDDYDYPIREVDVEAEVPDDYIYEGTETGSDERYPEVVPTESDEQGLVLSVNDSVKYNSSELTADRDDEQFSVEFNGGEFEENYVTFNETVSSNSTKPIERPELDFSIEVPSINETDSDVVASVPETTRVDGLPNVDQQSVVKHEGQEVLKGDSTVHNVNVRPYEFTEIVHSVPQQIQHHPVITPEHSVHVVYPQPIIEVMGVDHDHSDHLANQHNGNVRPNKPQVQFHNLNPIPIHPSQHHTSNPSPQMPLMEKAPEMPAKYGGYMYPPLAPHGDVPRPNPRPHNHPYHQHTNPHRTRYPPDNQNPSGQGGFVRFPSEPIQNHQEVNTVRFPLEDTRNNDKYSRWGNWRFEEGRRQVPQREYWAGAQGTQYPQGTNRRNYWVDNRPNRRRPQPGMYYGNS